MNDQRTRAAFANKFAPWPGRVHRRLFLRYAITGVAVGLGVGLLVSITGWKLRSQTTRQSAWGLAGVGLVAATAIAWRRRWRDTEVALYLDGVWQSDEAITTAVELSVPKTDPSAPVARVMREAVDVIDRADPKAARPRVFMRHHAAIVVLGGALFWSSTWPLPPLPPAPAAPPGLEQVRVADLKQLENVIALEKLRTPDPEQKKRLENIAQRARKLRAQLQKGMEKRKAQSEIAQLRDAVSAERSKFGTGKQRAGLEAARGRLAKDRILRKAAKALGDRDLTKFDQEMQKLANTLERADREAAKRALKEAEEQAKRRNAPGVAKMLAEQRKLFEERSKRGAALRELAKSFGKGLPPQARKELEKMDSSGLDPSAGKLSKRLAEALSKLTPEERKRLAERMRKQAMQGNLAPSTRQKMRDMAKQLDTPQGKKQLEKMLKEMAKEQPKSGAAERDKALGEAERGLGGAQRQLGGAPMPVPMPGQGGKPSPGTPSPGSSDGKSGPPGPGSHNDRGTGDHKGKTDKVGKDDFRARVGGHLNPGAPMPGTVIGRGHGAPGETANTQGMGAIGRAAPKEVTGVERSEVPEEYREQVGRYFRP